MAKISIFSEVSCTELVDCLPLQTGVPLSGQDLYLKNDVPYVIAINGQPKLMAQWQPYQPTEGDHVVAIPAVGGVDPFTITLIAVAVISTTVTILSLPSPNIPTAAGNVTDNIPDAAPSYSLEGQQNFLKHGKTVEVGFGTPRVFPSYGAQFYNKFEDNKEILFQTFCIGVGDYDMESLFVADTPAENFDVTTELVKLGEQAELFRTNVRTVEEISNIELYATNETDYDGYTAPVVVNAAGTKCDVIEFDIVIEGLYEQPTTGSGLLNQTITLDAQYREIDDGGVAIGSWQGQPSTYTKITLQQRQTAKIKVTRGRYYFEGWNAWSTTSRVVDTATHAENNDTVVYSNYSTTNANGVPSVRTRTATYYYVEAPLTFTAASFDPIRQSFQLTPATTGRFEFRIARTNTKENNIRVRSVAVLHRVKAYLEGGDSWSNKTMLLTRAVATNQLNNNVANRINGFFSRKLPVYDEATSSFLVDSEGLEIETYSANPIDHILHLIRSRLHGGIEDDNIIIEDFIAIRTDLENEGIEFHFHFEASNLMVLNVIQNIASTFNAQLIVEGTDYTIVRDVPIENIQHLVQPNNIVKGSFNHQRSMRQAVEDFDGVQVQYTNPLTWLPATVECQFPDVEGDNYKVIELPSVTNELQAWRLGMREISASRYEREQIDYALDEEGRIPKFGAKVGFAHDVLRWSMFGKILDIDEATGIFFTQSEVEGAEVGETYTALFKKKNGDASEPMLVDCIGVRQFQLQAPFDLDGINLGDDLQKPIVQMATSEEEFIALKIRKFAVSGVNKIKITAVNYDERLYLYDDQFPPTE